MPTTKIGICPWCGEETMLFFTVKNYPGTRGFWMDYICGGCLEMGRKIAEETQCSQ